jgi:DNA-binding transcriptional ArsR family regulator
VDKIFRALADLTRRQLLDRLYASNGQTLSELCEPFHMSRQAVTQHLAVLEAAELVVIGWRGREKIHYLNPGPIYEIFDRWAKKIRPPSHRAPSSIEKSHRREQRVADGKTVEELEIAHSGG